MALNKEVWINQVMEGFYPDDSFLQKAKDFSEFVENDRLHIASAGIDPKVLIDNTTYPINTVEREDEDCEIILNKFETENTIVRRPDAIEYSYDKLESVIGQHRATLRKSVAMKAIHAYAPAVDTADTPVILTSGLATNGRKRLTFADIRVSRFFRWIALGFYPYNAYLCVWKQSICYAKFCRRSWWTILIS